MHSSIHKRLGALENADRAAKGWRMFQQDHDDPRLFFEGAGPERGKAWNEEEIGALSEQGWQVLMIVYEERPARLEEQIAQQHP